MGDRRERIGCEGSTGEATTIQLKRRQKRVRVHKYCQLAEFGHRWQRGLIAYLATIGSVRRPSSFSCSYSSCNQEQVTQRSIDRSVAERGQQLINGGLSYIYERAARPLLAAVWLIKRWQYGTYGCNPSCLLLPSLASSFAISHYFIKRADCIAKRCHCCMPLD